MAPSISRSQFLVLLLVACFTIAVLGSSSSVPKKKNSIVRDTCKRLDLANPKFSYSFCVKALSYDPRSRTADLKGLGLIAIERVSHSFNLTSSYIMKLLMKNQDSHTSAALGKCKVIYSAASQKLKQLVKEYKQKDYKAAAVLADSVTSSPSRCESEFKKLNPLKKQNDKSRKIGVVALSIVRLLAKQS